MASLISATEITALTGTLSDHFDSFKRDVVVFKEPKVTITNKVTALYPGYGNTSQSINNVSHTPVSGIFQGMLVYERDQKVTSISESHTSVSKGKVRLKVKDDAYTYIKEGKTENLQIDGLTFNVISDEGIQNYLGLKFFYFTLEQTT